ncbi:MAG: hypothetical protein IIC01_10105, partial [Planctomycetes bacterium]|nr:hypothetical protein [Planctomycetota bacterium]
MTTRREFVSDASKGLLGLAAIPALGQTASLGRQATGTGLIYDSRYLDHVLPPSGGEAHPERPLRLVRMMEVFAERGLDQELIPLSLLADPMSSIRAHHTPEHVESVRRIDVTGPVAELAVAGALGAVDAVARGQVSNAFCASRP